MGPLCLASHLCAFCVDVLLPSRLELNQKDRDLPFFAKLFDLSALTCKVEFMMSQTLKG
jgi:hypothetical protein